MSGVPLDALLEKFEAVAQANYARTEEASRLLMGQVEDISSRLSDMSRQLKEKEDVIIQTRLEYQKELAALQGQLEDEQSKTTHLRKHYENELAKASLSFTMETAQLRQELHAKQLSLIREANKLNLTLSALTVESREVPKLQLTVMERDKEIHSLRDEVAKLRDREHLANRPLESPVRTNSSQQREETARRESARSIPISSEVFRAKVDLPVAPFTPSTQSRALLQQPTHHIAQPISLRQASPPPVTSAMLVDDIQVDELHDKDDSKLVTRLRTEGGKGKHREGEMLALEAAKLAERAERKKRKQSDDVHTHSDTHVRTVLSEIEDNAPLQDDYKIARAALSPSDSAVLVGRKHHLNELNRLYGEVHSGATVAALLYGTPGQGKTSTVNAFIDSLRGRLDSRKPLIAKLNCRAEKPNQSIYSRIAEILLHVAKKALAKDKDHNNDLHDPKDALFRTLDALCKGNYIPVIILDEVDALPPHTSQGLLSLEFKSRRLSILLLGIANNFDLVKGVKDQHYASMLEFRPYTPDEFYDIAKLRLRKTHVFHDSAIRTAADKENKRKGDARMFLACCRKALDLAVTENAQQVTADHVSRAYIEEDKSNLHPSLICLLIALARDPKRTIREEDLPKALDRLPVNLCRFESSREWKDALGNLEDFGAVQLAKGNVHLKMDTGRLRSIAHDLREPLPDSLLAVLEPL